ncbi:hypothetical protein ACNKHU_21070 [Shigella flexneri]
MRLDQPGETNTIAAAVMNARENNSRQPNHADREAQPAGNHAMMDALAAAMGKKR